MTTENTKWREYPEVMGIPITREEIIEGFRDSYQELRMLRKRQDPGFVGYPDYEMIIDWIEENGLPPRTENCPQCGGDGYFMDVDGDRHECKHHGAVAPPSPESNDKLRGQHPENHG